MIECATQIKEFKEFIAHGNLVDLAVAVVIGAAFAALIKTLVEDLITPIIAAIFGQPDFSALKFTINHSVFLYGSFLNAVITFLSVAAAIFFSDRQADEHARRAAQAR